MEKENFNEDEISRLINSAFDSKSEETNDTLIRLKFINRLNDLDITFNQACENLEIEYRSLNSILDVTRRTDFLSILKVAQFLDMPFYDITKLYVDIIQSKHREELLSSKKRSFILDNFDLPTLKAVGIIDSIRDFNHIESNLKAMLNLQSITDYNTLESGAAFSSGKAIPKNLKTRKLFIEKSQTIFKLIGNPNGYDRDGLTEYFPKIRWHSIDTEEGFLNVIKSLYKLGVTVIFQPRMPSLSLRGATFSVNKKPCIVLTDYKGFYPTLWFALLHELFHVLFDWDEISEKKYHLSDEDGDLYVVKQKEEEANEFAREFMFPKAKMEVVEPQIEKRLFIKEYALNNHVHPSIIYANYAYAHSNSENNYWAIFSSILTAPLKEVLKKLTNGLTAKSKSSDYAIYYKDVIFNS